AGATTNSDSVVTKFDNIDSALAVISQGGMLLLVPHHPSTNSTQCSSLTR
ncbi:hypothetical protein PR002_g27400, partial [Phytophthora rubi]